MKFSKSEIYFILYVIMTVASVLIDFNDAYQNKLEAILKKIAQKTDDEVKNGN